MSFASNLKFLMDDKQIGPSELAKFCKKDVRCINQYLSGIQFPQKSVLLKICDTLECDIDDLVFGDAPEENIASCVSVAECARLIGKSEQFVRIALQTGAAPFGFAVRNKSSYCYHISRKKLYEYIGGCNAESKS